MIVYLLLSRIWVQNNKLLQAVIISKYDLFDWWFGRLVDCSFVYQTAIVYVLSSRDWVRIHTIWVPIDMNECKFSQ